MLSVPSSMEPSRPVCFRSSGIECLVSTLQINEKRLQVVVIYRSPCVPMPQFLVMLERVLQYVDSSNDATMVLGDVNCDVSSSSYYQLERLMCAHGLPQLVEQATTDRATVIDHVYFSRPSNDVFVQVQDVYYSDHDAVYCSVPVCLL